MVIFLFETVVFYFFGILNKSRNMNRVSDQSISTKNSIINNILEWGKSLLVTFKIKSIVLLKTEKYWAVSWMYIIGWCNILSFIYYISYFMLFVNSYLLSSSNELLYLYKWNLEGEKIWIEAPQQVLTTPEVKLNEY